MSDDVQIEEPKQAPVNTQPPQTDEQRAAQAEALVHEAAGYAATGREDRLEQVNAQLESIGAAPFKAERATSKSAAKRQTR